MHLRSQEQRRLTKQRAKKAATSRRRRSKRRFGGCGRDGPAATQLQLKLCTHLDSRVKDLDAATYCTLFPPKESDIVKEMQDASRAGNKPPRQRKRTPAHLAFFLRQVRGCQVNMSVRKKHRETQSHHRRQTGEPRSTKPASTLCGRCHHADAWKLNPKTGCTVL